MSSAIERLIKSWRLSQDLISSCRSEFNVVRRFRYFDWSSSHSWVFTKSFFVCSSILLLRSAWTLEWVSSNDLFSSFNQWFSNLSLWISSLESNHDLLSSFYQSLSSSTFREWLAFIKLYLACESSESRFTNSLLNSTNSFSLLFASKSQILNFNELISSTKLLIFSASDTSLSFEILSVSILSSKNSS